MKLSWCLYQQWFKYSVIELVVDLRQWIVGFNIGNGFINIFILCFRFGYTKQDEFTV